MATTDNVSNYLRDAFNDMIFGNTSFTRPSNTRFTPMIVAATASGGGTPAAGYLPLVVTNNNTNWPASVSRVKASGADMNFGNNSSTTTTLVSMIEDDNGSPPNLLTFEDLAASILVNNGDNFTIPTGLFTFSYKGGVAVAFDPTSVSVYSDYLVDKMNDHLHGGPNFTVPSTLYLELVTAIGKTDGSGATPAPGWSRLSSANNSTNWPASSGQNKTNGVTLSFGTNGSGPATITGIRVFDASTMGNLLTLNTLGVPVVVASGAPFTIPVGAQIFGWHA
jgi:hypothetical protein